LGKVLGSNGRGDESDEHVVLSVPVLLLFQKAGIPALTAPFVMASWIVLRVSVRNSP
jgi:urea transporter